MVTTANRAVPETPEQLEEELLDDDRRADIFGNGEKSVDFMRRYADAYSKRDKGETGGQLKDQMATVLKEFYESNDAPMPDQVKRLPETVGQAEAGDHHAIYKRLGMSDHERRQIAGTGRGPGMDAGEFRSFGEFLVQVAEKGGVLKALNESSGDQGGFLVPEEFRAELLRLALETAVIRPRARVIPMTRPIHRIPVLRDTTHASTVYGGVWAYYVAESGSVTQTEPTFAQAVLEAKKLLGGTRVSSEEMVDSAIALEALLTSMFADAIAYVEDNAFINGIGGAQPVGILNADALVSVAKETGQSATTFVTENVVKMFSRMLPSSLNRAVWLMHNDVIPQLYTLSLTVGTGGSAMFMPQGGIGGAPGGTLLGRPVIFTEKCQTLGTAGDVYLVDPAYYLIGDRQALTMAASEHSRFSTDEIEFRFTQRHDGRLWLDSALTPRNGSNTVSPAVSLATRS